MRDMLEEKLSRFDELERAMSDPAVQADSKKMAAVAREHGSLVRLAMKYRQFKRLVDEIAELQRMTTSPQADERELAEAELPAAREQREKLWLELLDMTVGGEGPAGTRRPCSPATCTRCTSGTRRPRAGSAS
jgi:peptide chain release factor 1